MSDIRKTITAALLIAAIAPPATAAEFRLEVEENVAQCSLILEGPDDLLIQAPQGGGVLSGAYLLFLAREDDYEFDTDILLQFVFDPARGSRKLIGVMDELYGVPGFEVPLGFIALMSGGPYNYTLEGRAPVQNPAIPEQVVKQFEECLMQPQSAMRDWRYMRLPHLNSDE